MPKKIDFVEISDKVYVRHEHFKETSVVGEPDPDFDVARRVTISADDEGNPKEETLENSQLVGSITHDVIRKSDWLGAVTETLTVHRPVIDIDFPVRAIPSTTEGHTHLYIDVDMTEDQYFKLLDAMAEAGIVEHRYVDVSKSRGYTAVRLPWVKKEVN